MDFHNESYVRVYTRNTSTWLRLGYDAQCLMLQLLRVVDMAGVLDLEDMTPVEASVLHTGAPPETAAKALKTLVQHKVVEIRGAALWFPRFKEAQEANKSDKQRQRESRDKRRADVAAQPLSLSQDVTFDEQDEELSRETELGVEENYTLPQCSALQGSTMSSTAVQCHEPSQIVTSVVVPFRRPLPEPPPDAVPSSPPLWRTIIKLHADAYGQKRPGLSPPRREEAAQKLAAWCSKSALAWRQTPLGLAEHVIVGLFRSDRAAEKRWPLGFAANDPEEYLPPPEGAQAVRKPPASTRPGFTPSVPMPQEELDRLAVNNPDWVTAEAVP